MLRNHCQFVLWAFFAFCASAFAEHLPHFGTLTPGASLASISVFSPVPLEPVIKPAVVPCAPFVEPFDVDEYNGPLSRVVSRFSQSVDSATPHLKHSAGLRPCAMTAGDKFRVFVNNTIDPVNYVGAAWDAGWAQLDHDDPAFGQGAAGYGKNYSAAVVDNIQGDFFGIFLYPSLFHQDPRYYRLGEGGVKARIGHALAHRIVARSDSGDAMPNYSEWFATVSSKALSNLYHPGNPRGFGPTAERVGWSVSNDVAWDVLREFWPEIAHKFRLPFRTNQVSR